MHYNQLGRSGLRVSQLGLGSWITFGRSLLQDEVRDVVRAAVRGGINLFDTAEAYGQGVAESLLGEALREFRREDIVVCTKILWGGAGPNRSTLSWKHLVEGTKRSLARLGLDYVDLLLCHRPDPTTPIAESVRAMDYLVRSGHAFYWGTSEWPAPLVEEAYTFAVKHHCVPPALEQPQYNLFVRHRVEEEYRPLCHRYGMGLTTFSPLACGVLSGKYQEKVSKKSRLGHQHWLLRRELTPERAEAVSQVCAVAKELSCTPSQLAIAWCLTNPQVSSVLLGVSSVLQLQENLGALRVLELLSPPVLETLYSLSDPPELATRSLNTPLV